MDALEPRRQALSAELEALALPSGGFPYRPGGGAFVEPTALALLALAPTLPPAPPTPLKGTGPAARSLRHLLACQLDGGSFGTSADDSEPSWATSLAILALAAHGHSGNVEVAAQTLEAWTQNTSLDDATKAEVKRLFGIDVNILAWPWYGSTSAWVDPTCYGMLALLAAGRPVSHPRIVSGVRFLEDRVCGEGGWNYGNPHVFGATLEPVAMTTGLALVALARAGVEGGTRTIGSSLDRLEHLLAGSLSGRTLAWSAWGLAVWGRSEAARRALDRVAPLPGSRSGPGAETLAVTILAIRSIMGTAPTAVVRAPPNEPRAP